MELFLNFEHCTHIVILDEGIAAQAVDEVVQRGFVRGQRVVIVKAVHVHIGQVQLIVTEH